MPAARAYILMEVAIGGALVALLAATLMSSLADARVRNVVAGRDVVASSLALAKLEQQRSLGFAKVGADVPASCTAAGVTENAVTGQQGKFTRTCQLANVNTAVTIRTVTIHCTDVNVTVTYVANASIRVAGGARTVSLRSRVCS